MTGVWLLAVGLLSAASPVIPKGVKESVRKCVDFGYVPGIAVRMVNPDRTTHSSYGDLTHESATSVDENSLYEIASVTKTFTTVLLAEMVESGDISRRDKVGSFYPKE